MKTIRYFLVLFIILAFTIPVMAGNGNGGPGGGPFATPTPVATEEPGGVIPDTGELYGDLYVILRDENGIPILSPDGCIQPISTVTASTTIATITGDLIISVTEGEPFPLPTYYDPAGDLVECELTEAMSTWVEGVDFGRLNLGRAPDSVLAHAFDEAVKKMNVAIDINLDPAGRLLLLLPDEETSDPTDTVEKTIDAPAEGLALYIEMMKDGDWVLDSLDPIVIGGPPDGKGPSEGDGPSTELRPVLSDSAIINLLDLGFYNLVISDSVKTLSNDELILAASLLAAAADKTGTITLDKVVYINSIYGINQLGSLANPVTGKTYYDFGSFMNNRAGIFSGRTSGDCLTGWIWVLQPELDESGIEKEGHFVTTCIDILAYEVSHDSTINSVHFTDLAESYITDNISYDFVDNVRGFTQAADDALQVIEYIHNYKIPEELYPVLP